VRRSRLRPVSEKKLAAAGGVVFSTFAKKPASTGPHRDVVDLVLERDQHSCAWCGGCLWGDRGMDWSIGHRRPRRNGGDPRPDTNLPSNLVALHGSGTTGCHGEIERERDRAEQVGFLLTATAKPYEHKIRHAFYGWCFLNEDGGVRQIAGNP
jgi:hypothetical protein